MYRYIVTADLLNAWQDWTSGADDGDLFRMILSGSPITEPENSIAFMCEQHSKKYNDFSMMAGVSEICRIVDGGTWYMAEKSSCIIDASTQIDYRVVADVINGFTAYKILPVNKWTSGMMSKNIESSLLKSVFPEIHRVRYILLDNKSVYTETYYIQDIPYIEPILSEFFDWIKNTDLFDMYKKKWGNK